MSYLIHYLNCLTNGENARITGQQIRKKLNNYKEYEAERIARTEITHSLNYTKYDRMMNDDLVEFFQWHAAHDSRTRASHLANDGEIVRKGEPFSNGQMYPGDKSVPVSEFVNCRCSLAPYIPEYGKIAPPGMTRFKESDIINITQQRITEPTSISLLKQKNSNRISYNEQEKVKTKHIKEIILIHNKQDKRNIDWLKIKTIDDIKTTLNYEFKIVNGEYHFYDTENRTKIIFGRRYTRKNRFIDPINEGNSLYDLIDMLMFYEVIPNNIKKIIPSINFKNSPYKNKEGLVELHTLGFTNPYTFEINIFPSALRRDYNKRGNIAQTLYHEVGHIVDRKMAEVLVTLGRFFGISEDELWNEAVQKDLKLQKQKYIEKWGTDEGFEEELASWYSKYGSHEDWAETFSMGIFAITDNKIMAILENNNKENRNFIKWEYLHPNTLQLAITIIDFDWSILDKMR